MGYRANYIKVRGPIPEGWHVHHIIPRCEGGTDDASNLIALHPNMHQWVHLMRGDKRSSSGVYNMRNGHSEETKKKIGDRVYPTGKDHPLFGVGHTEESRRKMSESRKGKKASDDTRRRQSESKIGDKNHFYGKTHSEETRKLISATKKRERVCPHCGKQGQEAGMLRWHFNNCKELS